MKKIFIFAATAALLASCAQDEVLNNYEPTADKAIGFSTFASKATRAENSTAETKYGLEDYYNTFKVWGYKVVNGTGTGVFDGTVVTYDDDAAEPYTYDWTYTPLRFWDKAAKEYYFYAYSPSDYTGFTLVAPTTDPKADKSDMYFKTTTAYALVGSNASATGSKAYVESLTKTGDFTAEGADKDLLIAEPCKAFPLDEKVNLSFIHILSRLNVAVHKADLGENVTITLNTLEVANMQKDGTFDESKPVNPTVGSNGRWDTTTTPNKTLNYTAATVLDPDGYELTASTTPADYIIQSLVIPQDIKVQGINLDGTIGDGTTVITPNTTTSDNEAYVHIKYTVTTTDGAETNPETNEETFDAYYNLATIFNTATLKDASGRVAYKTKMPSVYLYLDAATGIYYNAYGNNVSEYVYYDATTDKYYDKYETELVYDDETSKYYNTTDTDKEHPVDVSCAILVTVTGTAPDTDLNPISVTRSEAGETTVDFSEGWQNNLYITISPSVIKFDAEVYKWVTKYEGEITVE